MIDNRATVLCVDDEPNLLEGLEMTLGGKWNVALATSGAQGLALIEELGPFSVVLSDMRMPEMDGAAFLGRVRQSAPDTVRLLLTGQTGISAAISAVNEGQIFRFLSKPCPPAQLVASVESAMQQHALITAERVLLEETLRGSVQALVDVLALANPIAFGRAARIKGYVSALACKLEVKDAWWLDIAAMLSQIGTVTLAPELVEKLHAGAPLDEDERAKVATLPALADQLLRGIPRLELVRGILARYAKASQPTALVSVDDPIAFGGEALRLAIDFDALEARGVQPEVALDVLRARTGRYDTALFAALVSLYGQGSERREVRELALAAVRIGMTFAADVRLRNGTLLVARGYEVTDAFVERVKSSRIGAVREPVSVYVPSAFSRVQGSAPERGPHPKRS